MSFLTPTDPTFRNVEGLTWLEWARAAGFEPKPSSAFLDHPDNAIPERICWVGGVDPTDWRAHPEVYSKRFEFIHEEAVYQINRRRIIRAVRSRVVPAADANQSVGPTPCDDRCTAAADRQFRPYP